MNTEDMKKERDSLWESLHQVLAEMAPLKEKEAEIRSKIKPLQDKIYLAEMGPKITEDLKKINPEKYNLVKAQCEAIEKRLY